MLLSSVPFIIDIKALIAHYQLYNQLTLHDYCQITVPVVYQHSI